MKKASYSSSKPMMKPKPVTGKPQMVKGKKK
jgi:hypothetical protein